MNWTLLAFVSFVAVLTLLAAWGDARRGKISNWLSAVTMLSGLVFQASAAGWPGLQSAALGAAIGFGLLLLLWLIGGSGAGDVKFTAGLGAWLGPQMILMVFVASAMLVAAAALGLGLCQLLGGRKRLLGRDEDRGRRLRNFARWRLPYAIPLTIATWGVLAWRLVPRLFS
ncbi:MAG TPA: A24 family peptidase [Pirellulales bacterium]|nr:A24 family peptidase [Pirellulales bacterium]